MATRYFSALLVVLSIAAVASAQMTPDEAYRRLAERQAQAGGGPARAADEGGARPSTRPAAARVDPRLLASARAHLRARAFAEAAAEARQFQAALPPSQQRSPTEPDAVMSFHVLAVAELQSGHVGAAAEAMAAVRASGASDGSVLFNGALIDVRRKTYAVRAIRALDARVRAHPTDERAIDLWGLALDAAADLPRVADLPRMRADFDAANAVLERTRPGQRHWGASWLTAAAYDDLIERRAELQKNADAAREKLDALTAARDRAVADYHFYHEWFSHLADEDMSTEFGEQKLQKECLHIYHYQVAAQQAEDAERAIPAAAEALRAAAAAVPQPDWGAIEPLEPEVIR